MPRYNKLVSKLVLVVVDGMRNDMAKSLTSLGAKGLRKYDCGMKRFVAKAETPTVTMPRIKAMVTGTK